MIKTQITCDFCRNDLSYTDNVVDYRLVLRSEHIPIEPSLLVCTSAMKYPYIKGDLHFCGIQCLKEYFAK